VTPGDRAIPGWNTEKMAALGHLHADLEGKRELEPLLETMIPEPAYAFYPCGLALSGGDNVRRYYTQFFGDFMTKIRGYSLRAEWVNDTSVAQEYDITLDVDGEPETHRVLGVLFAEQGPHGVKLGGERIYGSERIVRLMTGAMYEELEPLEPS
jgi:hypothetical protein